MPGTDVATRNGHGMGLQTGGGLTPDQVGLVKRQILVPKSRQATDDELALFLGQCERTGLDPFARQIYGIYRRQQGQEKLTIQTSIDGFRLVAERSGKYIGQDGPFWCGSDGQWKDVWFAEEAPKAARVIVKKVLAGTVGETPAVAHFTEYAQTYDGKPTGQWGSMPALMIAKCAEALALRKAFPQELSGLYTAEEMAQADHLDGPVSVSRHSMTPPPAPEPEPLDDASVKDLVDTLVENRPSNEAVRNKMIAIGAPDVPAVMVRESDGAVNQTPLRKLTGAQALELAAWAAGEAADTPQAKTEVVE